MKHTVDPLLKQKNFTFITHVTVHYNTKKFIVIKKLTVIRLPARNLQSFSIVAYENSLIPGRLIVITQLK